MSKDYTKAVSTANRLIKRFGRKATLIQPVPGDGPGFAPGSNAPIESPCDIVTLQYSIRERENTAIQQNDQRVLMAVDGLLTDPSPSAKLEVGGRTYAIINADPLNPGDTVVLWELQVRT